MTMAVCCKCGVIKFGAFVPCPECGGFPRTEDELALSLAMTDHYFDMPTLKQIGASVKAGKPPDLGPETHAQLVQQIRESGMLGQIRGMFDETSSTPKGSLAGRPPPRKPRWKFW